MYYTTCTEERWKIIAARDASVLKCKVWLFKSHFWFKSVILIDKLSVKNLQPKICLALFLMKWANVCVWDYFCLRLCRWAHVRIYGQMLVGGPTTASWKFLKYCPTRMSARPCEAQKCRQSRSGGRSCSYTKKKLKKSRNFTMWRQVPRK